MNDARASWSPPSDRVLAASAPRRANRAVAPALRGLSKEAEQVECTHLAGALHVASTFRARRNRSGVHASHASSTHPLAVVVGA